MKGILVMTSESSNEKAAELRKWYDNQEQQVLRELLDALLVELTDKLQRNGFEGADKQADVAISFKKKRLRLRGYSHHITWDRGCRIYEFSHRFGISDMGRFVRHTSIAGFSDSNGDRVLHGSPMVQTYFTNGWYAITVDDVRPHELQPLVDTLRFLLSD